MFLIIPMCCLVPPSTYIGVINILLHRTIMLKFKPISFAAPNVENNATVDYSFHGFQELWKIGFRGFCLGGIPLSAKTSPYTMARDFHRNRFPMGAIGAPYHRYQRINAAIEYIFLGKPSAPNCQIFINHNSLGAPSYRPNLCSYSLIKHMSML